MRCRRQLPLCHPPPRSPPLSLPWVSQAVVLHASPALPNLSSAFPGIHRLWPFTVSHRRPCLSPLVSASAIAFSFCCSCRHQRASCFHHRLSLDLAGHYSLFTLVFLYLPVSECWPVVWFAFKSVFLHFPLFFSVCLGAVSLSIWRGDHEIPL